MLFRSSFHGLPVPPTTTRLSLLSKKSGNAPANVDYITARDHLLSKVVPDEEPPAPSKYIQTFLPDSLYVEVVLLFLLHVLLLLLCTGENHD